MLANALADLRAAVERLTARDPDSLDDEELHDVVVQLAPLMSGIEAAWVSLIHRWDTRRLWAADGSKSAGARLARESRWAEGHAKRLVRRGRQLTSMPVTAAAYRRGEISGAHVDLVATCDREWANATFDESEELLVENCRTPWFANAVKATRYWQMMADRDRIDRDHGSNVSRLSASTGWNGELKVDGVFDPIAGEIVKSELDRLAEEIRVHDLRDGIERTPAERRGAALVEMATRSATAPADGLRPRPLITVTMGLGHFAWMCQTAAGTVIAPDVVLPYLADADIERIVYDPPKRTVEASHRRRFTGAMAKIIRLRDQACQHPGCNEASSRCDIDHIEPHGAGGITCICNGQLLCRFHNRVLKAEGDRRLVLLHQRERDDERHLTGCLVCRPEPCRYRTDAGEDAGSPPARVPDPDSAPGGVRRDGVDRHAG